MLLIIFFTWFLGGFFVVHVNEQGVITNLGKYSYILKNGCYWRPRFITSIHIVDMNSSYLLSDVHNVITVEHDIVKILIKVHYKIINPIQYCFSSANPKRILIQSINNKIYHLSQHVFLRDFFINHGTMFNSFIKNSIQNIINTYHLGVQIIDIDCAKMSFPKYMHMYWKKSILSKKYKEQCILNAEHYADRVLAIALYHAKKILQEVEYYKIRKIAEMKSKRLHIF
ncbi:MAG: SPFH domain-containing protein [Buchnera aphidicola (Eriosoma harunire)]